MMASAGSIFVDLLLNDGSYRDGLARSGRYTQNSTRQWNRHFTDVTTSIESVTRAVTRLAATAATFLSVQSIIRYSDQWKSLEGRLNVVSETSEDLAYNQERLFDIAQRSRSGLDSTVTLYQRLTQATKGLGISQEQVFKFTEKFNKALVTAGLSGSELRSVTYQLTQAFNKGKLDGDEFRSVLENAPPVLEALVASLRMTNESLAEARKRIIESAKEGAITPDILLRAVNNFDKIEARFKKFPLTVGQAFTQLDNAFLKFVGQSDAIEAGTSSIASAVSSLARNFDQLAAAVGALAIVLAARLIPSLGASLALFSAKHVATFTTAVTTLMMSTKLLSNEANALGASLGIMPVELVTRRVATLRVAVTALTTAFKRLLLPLAAFAIIQDILDGNESLIETQEKVTESVEKTIQKIDQMRVAHGSLTKDMVNDVETQIAAFEIQFNTISARLDSLVGDGSKLRSFILAIGDVVGESMQGINNFFGGTFEFESGTELIGKLEIAKKAAETLNKALNPDDNGEATGINVGFNKEIKKFLEKQREVNESMKLEADLIGKTTVEVEKLKAARELEAEARVRSLEMGEGEREVFMRQIEGLTLERQRIIQSNYDLSRSFETGWNSFFTSFVENANDTATQVRDVLTGAFKSAEDAFVQFTQTGKISFRELASSIIEDLIRIQFRRTVANFVTGALNLGAGVAGGGASSTPVPAFADGGYLPPGQFGVAGEAGAELLYGGKTGVSVFNQDQMSKGNTYNIDARGADQSAIARLEGALLALAGPGVIEKRMISAQQRGAV